jgi:hypothetical protein
VELFEQIRREYEHGGGTIRGIAKKLGIPPHRRFFLPNHRPFRFKRYVLCSVKARQPWLVAVCGTPSHGL